MENNEMIWQESRLGYFTASNIWKLLKSGKSKDSIFGETALTYIDEKIAEIITGEAKDSANVYATEWGRKNEEDAIKWYAMVTKSEVEHYGGLNPKYFPFNTISGGSPDGICLTNDAIIEIKCPFNSCNHLEYMYMAVGSGDAFIEWFKKEHFEYYAQCQFNMMCCNKKTAIFISYDPRTVDHELRMINFTIKEDIEFQELIKDRIAKASEIVKDKLAKLELFKATFG